MIFRKRRKGAALLVVLLAAAWQCACADEVASRFGVDAPELAQLGEFPVGVRTLSLVEPDMVDVLAYDAATGRAPKRNRSLEVELWYPAQPAPGAARVVYSASFPGEPPSPPIEFTVPGLAVRDAPLSGENHPLVVVSHGYSNDPVAMAWITENLASKGYVVAAIRHADPPITDAGKVPEVFYRRPLDIVFVADSLRKTLGTSHWIDPSRIALLGYSMGGYGVLTAGGGSIDPDSRLAQLMPGHLLGPYVRGGKLHDAVRLKGVRAIVAISPAGGGLNAWGADGLEGITAPLLLIAGNRDHTVDYASGARAFFDAARNAPRYLLTFKNAGHDIGLIPAPAAMRGTLWNQDWFADPVWRTERVNAIQAHFITAFLGRYLKGEESYSTYLDVPVPESDAGVWPAATPPAAYAAYSPGGGEITLWKGFQRHHAEGLQLLRAPASGGAGQ